MSEVVQNFPGITIAPRQGGGWVVRYRTYLRDAKTGQPLYHEKQADSQPSLMAIILELTTPLRTRLGQKRGGS